MLSGRKEWIFKMLLITNILGTVLSCVQHFACIISFKLFKFVISSLRSYHGSVSYLKSHRWNIMKTALKPRSCGFRAPIVSY